MRKLHLPLPVRLSLAATAVLVATTVAADVLAVRHVRRNLTGAVAESLTAMVARMARRVDDDVAALRRRLAAEADALAGKTPEEAKAALLQRREALDFYFNFGVFLLGPSGNVMADSREREPMRAANFAGADFFQRTYALGRGVVSEPFAAPPPDSVPVAVFTAPVRDAAGRMTGMLAGGVELDDNRMLLFPTELPSSRYGQIGVFTMDGQVVAHSDRSIILDFYENPLPEPDGDGESYRTAEIVTAEGERALLAASRLREVDWLVAGVFPTAEVYAPLDDGLAAAHAWFAGGLILCCALVWLVSARGVRDLNRLAREVEGMAAGNGPPDGVRVGEGLRGEAAMLAAAVNAMLDGLETAERDKADLSVRLEEAEERERREIAADLHDSVCQTLALANLRLGGVKKDLPAGSRTAATLAEVRALLEQSVGQLRTLTFNLSPGILYELGLVPALEWYAGEFSKKYGVSATVRAAPPVGDIDGDVSMFLYRAAGELMTNAAKHSGGTAVAVSLARRDGVIELAVSDNGGGPADRDAGAAGFGLRNIRERARRHRGTATLEPGPGGGAVATVRIPL